MSHLSTVSLVFKDKDTLVQALVDLGMKREHIQIHDEAVTMSDGKSKANLLIGKNHLGREYAYTEMGFELTAEGYKPHLDEWHFNKAWQEKLSQRYGYNAVAMKAKARGYRLTEEKVVVDWLDKQTGKTTKKECVQLRLTR